MSIRPRIVMDDDEGAVAILVGILVVVLFGIPVFPTAFGMAYGRLRQLQAASDGAALAAAKTFADSAAEGLSCATVISTASSAARATAVTYAGLNWPVNSALATGAAPSGWGGDAGVAYRCNPAGNVEVQVTTTNTSPVIFAGVFGASGFDLVRSATAAMGAPTAVQGLRPFAVCESAVDALIAQDKLTPGAAQLIPLTKTFGGSAGGSVGNGNGNGNDDDDDGNGNGNGGNTPCGGAAGNWGTVDYDGGSNPVGDIVLWTDVGYPLVIDLGADQSIQLDGDPGFPNPNSGNCTTGDGCQQTVNLGGALNDILGQQSVLPVYDQFTGSGQTAEIRVIGFLGVRICGWKIGNRSGTVPDPTFGGTSCYDNSAAVRLPSGNNSDDALQVRVTAFIPIGSLSSYCGLGGGNVPVCSTNLRVTQLIQ